MKHFRLKLLVLLLALSLCLPLLAGCSGKSGKTLIEIEGVKVSVNVYELLLSRMKGALARAQGTAIETNDFWTTVVDTENTTYEEYLRDAILENAKTYAVGTYLHDKVYGLKLPKATMDAIDAELADFIEYDGDGSKAAFNRVLSEFGVNYNILREVYVMEAKIDALKVHLYGANASKIADTVKDEYCQEHFVRFKQVFLASYYYVCETDANGDDIYYTINSLGNQVICYDKENGTTKTDTDGNVIKDKDGYEVYFTEDGKIAYDKETGKTAFIFDKDGQPVVGDYTKEELVEIKKEANTILSKIPAGEYDAFEIFMEQRGEDEDAQTYENGYYLYNDPDSYASYPYLESIVEALGDMEVGEVKLVESDYGYHVVMKYPVEKGAYADKANEDWFEGFEQGLIDDMFMSLCKDYTDKVSVNEDVLATVPPMKEIGKNYYY